MGFIWIVGSSWIFGNDFTTTYSGFIGTSPVNQSTLWSLPTADGTNGQFMKTDGNAHLSFIGPYGAFVSSISVVASTASFYEATFSTATVGPYHVDISTTGHLNAQKVNGSTVTSCGAGATLAGSDIAGTITTGSGSPTACTLTFAQKFTNTPTCVCSPNAGVSCGVSSSSNASVTFALSVTETKINYVCIGSD